MIYSLNFEKTKCILFQIPFQDISSIIYGIDIPIFGGHVSVWKQTAFWQLARLAFIKLNTPHYIMHNYNDYILCILRQFWGPTCALDCVIDFIVNVLISFLVLSAD